MEILFCSRSAAWCGIHNTFMKKGAAIKNRDILPLYLLCFSSCLMLSNMQHGSFRPDDILQQFASSWSSEHLQSCYSDKCKQSQQYIYKYISRLVLHSKVLIINITNALSPKDVIFHHSYEVFVWDLISFLILL